MVPDPIDREPVVLAVDDSPVDLELMTSYLGSRDLRVETAAGGEEAIRRAEALQPSLILLDVLMPGMTGFDTCRRLKTRPHLREIPVIFVTDLSDAQNKVRGFEAGGVDFVTKPIEPNELRARVNTQLRLHAMHTELVTRNQQLQAEVIRRVELAETLEEQRAFLQQVIDMIPQCVCVKTLDGRVALANRAMADLTQTTVQSLLGSPGPAMDRTFLAGSDVVRLMTAGRSSFQGEMIVEEEPFVDPSGTTHILHIVLRPLRDREGNQTQLLIVGTDITERKRIERELEGYRLGLEASVAARTAELRQRNRDLDIEVAERRRLQSAYLTAADSERRYLAQELHDGLGQDLVGTALMLEGAIGDLKTQRSVSVAHLERMSLAVRNALRVARDIAHGLAPLSATPGGLHEALHALRDRMSVSSGPVVDLDIDAPAVDMVSREACDQLYRIAQEAASNAMKHARAKRITIRLNVIDGAVRLEIADDGGGMGPHEAGVRGLGLHTMRDRATRVGGALQFLPADGGGTIVRCEVPKAGAA